MGHEHGLQVNDVLKTRVSNLHAGHVPLLPEEEVGVFQRLSAHGLSPRLLLPAVDQLVERNAVDLEDGPPDPRDVPHGPLHRAPYPLKHHLVVLVDEVQGAVPGEEGGDLLPVLYNLDPAALADGGVRLLRLHTDLLKNYRAGLRGALQRVGLVVEAELPALVPLV